MKTIRLKNIISAALALIMTVGIFAAIPSPAAAEEKIYGYSDLEPATMKFKEGGSGSDCDFVSVAEAYGYCAYYLDMAYLLKNFDVDEYLKQNEKGYIFMVAEPESGFAARYSTNSSGVFSSWAYPNKIVTSSDDDDSFYYQTSYLLCEFGRGTEKQSYDYICTFGNTKIFFESNFSSGYKPIKLTLKITSDKAVGNKVVYEKTIGIDLYKELTTVKSVDIYDFEFPGKHGAVMDTDAWTNVGNVVSIRYLDENKKTERTKLVAGDKGYVEFTVVMMQNAYVETPSQKIHYLMDRPKWDSSVKTNLKGSACSNIGTSSASHVTTSENQYVCKFYHSYEIADNADYVITQGTIGLTVPEAGAKANKDVETSNVKKIVRRGPTGAVTSSPQFTADKAAWFTIDKRGTMKYVDSFAAGNIYHALVKLTPYGNYYFNADSVAALKVPGADSFNIGYMKAGDVNGFVKEDGWYLLANFTVKNGNTPDTTPPDTTPITTPVTTPPATEPRTPMSLLPVGNKDIVTHDPAVDVSFEVMAQNAPGNVRYIWQACDSNGNVSDATELSNGQAFLLHGMNKWDNGKTFYYKCTAISGSDIASLVFSVKLELQYFDLKVSYSKTDITVTQGDVATITATTNVDISRATEKTIQWHVAKDQDGLAERDVDGANDLTFSIPTGSAGTYYYRCSIGCKLDGKFDSLDYTSASPWVKVTVKEKTVSPLTISVIGDKDLTLATSGTDYLFQVKTQNATGAVKYSWYACDQNGNVTDNKVLSATDTLVRKGGISEADRDKTLYFKCVATDSKNTASVVCSAILKTKYFDLTIKYNKLDLTAAQGESVSVAAQTNIDPALVSDLVIEWWRADNADGKNEKKVAGQSGLTLVVPTTAEGTAYYRCNVICKRDGEFSRTVYSSAKYVKVTVTAKAEVTAEPPVTTDKQQDVTTAALITPGEPDVTKEPTVDVTTAPEDVTSPADTTKTPEPAVTTGNTPSDRDSSGATVWVIIGVVAAALVAAVVAVLRIKKKRK